MDVIFLILLAVITLFAVINCAIRGLKRSLVRLVFVVIAAGLALYLMPTVSAKLAELEPVWSPESGSVPEELAALCPTLGAAVHGVSRAAWSALAYPVVFFLLCVLMTIPVSIVNRKTERTHQFGGVLVGLVIGVLGFSLAFAPLCSAAATVGDALPEGYILDEGDVAELIEIVGVPLDAERVMHANRVMRAEAVPGEPLLDLLTTVEENEKSVSISKELRNLLPLVSLYPEFEENPESLPKLLNAAADCAENSAFLTDTVDELQTAAREKWMNGEPFLGYDPQTPDGSLGELLAETLCFSRDNLTVRELADMLGELIGAENSPA